MWQCSELYYYSNNLAKNSPITYECNSLFLYDIKWRAGRVPGGHRSLSKIPLSASSKSNRNNLRSTASAPITLRLKLTTPMWGGSTYFPGRTYSHGLLLLLNCLIVKIFYNCSNLFKLHSSIKWNNMYESKKPIAKNIFVTCDDTQRRTNKYTYILN